MALLMVVFSFLSTASKVFCRVLYEFPVINDPLGFAHAAFNGAGFNQPDGCANPENARYICLDPLAEPFKLFYLVGEELLLNLYPDFEGVEVVFPIDHQEVVGLGFAHLKQY